MIEIKPLNKSDLKAYIESDEFYNSNFVPISKLRAISHINNPRADDKDIIMLLAYFENKLVGYIGILPDLIYNKEGLEYKFGWLSCIWVDNNIRGQGLSKKLVLKAFECWNNNICITDFTETAKKVYEKLDLFENLKKLKGVRLYNRLDLSFILPKKNNKYQKIKGLLYLFDNFFNFFLDLRFHFTSYDLKNIRLEYLNTIDKETINFISQRQQNQIFKRNHKEIDWILNFPWLMKGTKKDMFSEKYYFSYIVNEFNNTILKIRDIHNKLIGIIIFSKKDNNLKLPFIYYEKSHIVDIIQVIKYHIIKFRINSCTIFDNEIVNKFKHTNNNFIFKKYIERHFLISKQFNKKINITNQDIIEIIDGDSDSVFT